MDEKEFLIGAYHDISVKLLPNNTEESFLFLKDTFEKEGRESIFNKLINKFPAENVSLENCLYVLRNFKPKRKIKTKKWFREFCLKLTTPFKLKIITNGYPNQQVNKINSLKLPKLVTVEEVIYANKYEPKPSQNCFYKLKNFNKFKAPIFIGDSHTDEVFCKNLKIEFYNVNNLNKKFDVI